jgi:hypothetical protein
MCGKSCTCTPTSSKHVIRALAVELQVQVASSGGSTYSTPHELCTSGDTGRDPRQVYTCVSGAVSVTVFEEEGNCIVFLEMRVDELMRHLISGELTNYRAVHTSPEPLQ